MNDIEDVKLLTNEELKKALPKGVNKSIPDSLVNTINGLIQKDDLMRQGLKDNVLGFMTVLTDGRWAMKDYLNAVRFVTYRMSGLGVTDSYARTFPDRYDRLERDGASQKYISSITTQYNKSKVVTKLMEQAMVPVHLLNMDTYQEAINVQAGLMHNAKSEMVRMQAANSLLVNLKAPEKAKMEVEMTVNDTGVVQELTTTLQELAKKQLEMIQSGHMSVQQIAEGNIIEGEKSDDVS